MRLEYVRLQNWKAFPELDLRLDVSRPERNVAIIEGANGFGKTSLLEALILGLYGRDGTPMIGRAGFGGRTEQSYDFFLERALHRGARGQDAHASVEIGFSDTSQVRFIVQRMWYFTAAGRHRRADEDVRIWTGPDEDLVQLPEDDNRAAIVRDIVARTLIPFRLAPFFFFDGEHLDRLAGSDLNAQVRNGLETALGVPFLRTIMDDLAAYARDRRRQLRGVDGEALNEEVERVRAIEAQERELLDRLDELNGELTPLRRERDETVARIGALRGGSYDNFKRLFEDRERLCRERDLLQDRMRHIVTSDLALALAGPALRKATQEQLVRDGEIARQEDLLAISQERYAVFAAALADGTALKQAGVSAKQWPRLKEELQRIWEHVWSIDAGNVIGQRLHDYLGEADRLMVDRRVQDLETLAAGTISALSVETENAELAVTAADERIAEQRGSDALSQELADQLGAIHARIGALEEAVREVGRALEILGNDLAGGRSVLEALKAQADSTAPVAIRTERADAMGHVIAELVDTLLPGSMQALSKAVSGAYRAMAHKQVVDHVEIGADGSVALIDRHGEDIRQVDPSAGESQIFAFALMAAITGLATSFPIILDTPLARLDPEHRDRVLRYFAGLDRQIIFLSQPAELSDRYLAPLKPHVSDIIELTHAEGRSTSGSAQPKEALL